jgi:hypothetical protein
VLGTINSIAILCVPVRSPRYAEPSDEVGSLCAIARREAAGEVTLFNPPPATPPATGGAQSCISPRGGVCGRALIGHLAPSAASIANPMKHGPAPTSQTASRPTPGGSSGGARQIAAHITLPTPGRSPPPAHTVSQASPLRKSHGLGRTVGTSLDAAARSMARGVSGVWLRAVSRLGLACRGTVYLLVGYLALRLALAAHEGTAAPASSGGGRAGGRRAGVGTCPAGLARRRPWRVRAYPAHRGGVPAVARGRHGRQVASAGGVVVGMFAVRGVLPEHRPAFGGNSGEADGAVGAAAGHRRDRGLAANGIGPAAPGPGRGRCRGSRGWRWGAGRSGSTSGSGSPQRICPGRWP